MQLRKKFVSTASCGGIVTGFAAISVRAQSLARAETKGVQWRYHGKVRCGSGRAAARSWTMRTMKILYASLLATAIVFAPFGTQGEQEKPADAPHDMEHMQHGATHGGFMQRGMHHAAAHTVTLREGPMTLPANTSHMKMPQPPDLVWQIPFDGWLLAYHPKLVDVSGNAVPGTLLHHTAFWNENRADFLCPNKEEHIFGAGSEMTDWAEVSGYGYRVQKGDKIRIETMVYNPTETSYDKVYPAWMDVKACGDSSYDVKPGKSEQAGVVVVKYDGVLLGVGGHLHDYGRQVVLQDVSHKETVATLDARVDAQGHLEAVPVKLFLQEGGYKFAANDVLKISATYDNPTGKLLREGAMGIAVGYFVPADDKKMAALRRKAKPKHEMTGMSHDH